jgi:hypothetical protein
MGANPAVGNQLVLFGLYQDPLFSLIRKDDAGSPLQILGIGDLFHLESPCDFFQVYMSTDESFSITSG